MTATQPTVCYEIQVKGYLDERRAGWFEGMTVEPLPGGFTRITGPVPDQSALFGLLARVRDLNLELWRVEREPNPARRRGS